MARQDISILSLDTNLIEDLDFDSLDCADLYAKLEESKNEYKPYVYVKGFSKEAIEELSVKLVEGRFPENYKMDKLI